MYFSKIERKILTLLMQGKGWKRYLLLLQILVRFLPYLCSGKKPPQSNVRTNINDSVIKNLPLNLNNNLNLKFPKSFKLYHNIRSIYGKPDLVVRWRCKCMVCGDWESGKLLARGSTIGIEE